MRQWVLRALLLGSFSVLSSGAMAGKLPQVVKNLLIERGIEQFEEKISCRETKSEAGICFSVFINESQKPDLLYRDSTLRNNLPRTLILNENGKPIAEGMNKFYPRGFIEDDSTVKWVCTSTKADGSNGICARISENLFYVGSKTCGKLVRNLSDVKAGEKLSIVYYNAESKKKDPVKEEKTLAEWSAEADRILQSFANLANHPSNKFTEIFPVGTAAIIEHISEDTNEQKLSQLGGKKGINFILLKGATGDGNLTKYTLAAQRSLLETMGLGDLYIKMSEPIEYMSDECIKMLQETLESFDEGKVLYCFDEKNNFVRQEKRKSFLWLLKDFITSPQGLLPTINEVIRCAENKGKFLSDENYKNDPAVKALKNTYNKNVLGQFYQIHKFFGNIEGQNPKEITSQKDRHSYVQNLSDGLKKALLDVCALKQQNLKDGLLENKYFPSECKKQMKTLDLVNDSGTLQQWIKEGFPKFKNSINPLKNLKLLSDIIVTINNFQIEITDQMIDCFSPGPKESIDVLLSDNIGNDLGQFLKQNGIKSFNNLFDIKRVFEDNCSKLKHHRKLFSLDAITLDAFFEVQNTPFEVPDFLLEGKTRPTADELTKEKERGLAP